MRTEIVSVLPSSLGEKVDPTGNYQIHQVPLIVYKLVTQLFGGYVFRQHKNNRLLLKTSRRQRRIIAQTFPEITFP